MSVCVPASTYRTGSPYHTGATAHTHGRPPHPSATPLLISLTSGRPHDGEAEVWGPPRSLPGAGDQAPPQKAVAGFGIAASPAARAAGAVPPAGLPQRRAA